jgi:hypothetical protein
MGVILYVLFGAATSTKNEFGCPPCIRKKIAKFSLVNLFTSHLLWPFLILPWSALLCLMSFARGHSRTVLEVIRSR